MKESILFVLNGEPVEVIAAPETALADLLRDSFYLTGTKTGCRSGDCGACTVIVNGLAVNSCLIPVGKIQGANILTIEGLNRIDRPSDAGHTHSSSVASGSDCLHPIQQAFIDQGAVQCGLCIPGMIMSAKALLDQNPRPDEADIRKGMSGNLCRCTGYVKIEKAVRQAARVLREQMGERL